MALFSSNNSLLSTHQEGKLRKQVFVPGQSSCSVQLYSGQCSSGECQQCNLGQGGRDLLLTLTVPIKGTLVTFFSPPRSKDQNLAFA